MKETGYHQVTSIMEIPQNENSSHLRRHDQNSIEQQSSNSSQISLKQNKDATGSERNLYVETRPSTTICDTDSDDVIIEVNEFSQSSSPLIYKLTDTPPFYSLPLFVLQQGILAIPTPLLTTFLVSEIICAEDDDEIKARILSATFFMIGLSTFAMVTFGVRLPIFQGPNFTYVLPILAMINFDEFKCPAVFDYTDPVSNSTSHMVRISNDTMMTRRDFITGRINDLAGSLIAVGAVHFLIGVTGFVGIIQRFVGPITIVPIILLFGIQLHPVVVGFAQTHWATAALTVATAVVLGLYLEKYKTPIPFWTPARGFSVTWLPVHNVLAIFISILIGWICCFILTHYNLISNDPESHEFNARTDARFQVVHDMNWFLFPYPGHFGAPGFNLTAAIAFLIATLMSVLDSIIDYSASAKISCAPQPPGFAVNRGIAVEGLMVLLGGTFGCGHGTVSFSENIGAMKLCRVVSVSVFQWTGIMYMIFAFFGKFGAFFITIPHSVMGGSQIITFGLLIGVILSYLQFIDLNSTRNLSILGISLILGMIMPKWMGDNETAVDTGSYRLDTVIKIFLSNPSFVGGVTAIFLDNSIPGTKKERGIAYQIQQLHNLDDDDDSKNQFRRDEKHSESSTIKTRNTDEGDKGILLHGREIYLLPWIPASFRKSILFQFIPIFDNAIPTKDIAA